VATEVQLAPPPFNDSGETVKVGVASARDDVALWSDRTLKF